MFVTRANKQRAERRSRYAAGIGLALLLLGACSNPESAGSASPAREPSASQATSAPTEAASVAQSPITSGPRPLEVGTLVASTSSGIGIHPTPRSSLSTDEVQAGELLYVAARDGPEDADAWYLVASIALLWTPDSADERSFGWIGPLASLAGALTEETPDCPPSPIAADTLQAMPPLQRLACYGGSPMEVAGVVPEVSTCCGPAPDYVVEPFWLSSLFGPYVGQTGLTIHFEPDAETVDLQPGDIVKAVGALDSPRAEECVAKTFPAGDEPVALPELHLWAVLFCRTQFVVSTISVTPAAPH